MNFSDSVRLRRRRFSISMYFIPIDKVFLTITNAAPIYSQQSLLQRLLAAARTCEQSSDPEHLLSLAGENETTSSVLV